MEPHMAFNLVMKFAPVLFIGAVAFSSATGADDSGDHNMESFRKCAPISDDAARLACYDKAASVFDFAKAKAKLAEAAHLKAETERLKAEAAREKATADKLKAAAEQETARLKADAARERAQKEAVVAAEEQRQADLSALALEQFGQPGADQSDLSEIISTVIATKQPKVGGVYIKLENGHIWQLVDGKAGRLKSGMTVRIQETNLGGLFMEIEETGRSFRVKRVN